MHALRLALLRLVHTCMLRVHAWIGMTATAGPNLFGELVLTSRYRSGRVRAGAGPLTRTRTPWCLGSREAHWRLSGWCCP